MNAKAIPNIQPKNKTGIIPHSVAVNPAIVDGAENGNNFLISFTRYNNKECGIQDLQKNGPKKALQDLIKMGITDKKENLRNKNIDTIPVNNSNEYTKLYKSLPADIEILEHKLHGTERIFYYIVNQIIFIVAITSTHYQTTKK